MHVATILSLDRFSAMSENVCLNIYSHGKRKYTLLQAYYFIVTAKSMVHPF